MKIKLADQPLVTRFQAPTMGTRITLVIKSYVTGRHWGPKRKRTFVCRYMAPPNKCYYNTVLLFFVVECGIACFLCSMHVFELWHHPHPLDYLCAKFCFFRGLRCWANPWRKIAYSITQSPSLFDPRKPKHNGTESHTLRKEYSCISFIVNGHTTHLLWSSAQSFIHTHSGSRSSMACSSSFAFTVTLASLNVGGFRVVPTQPQLHHTCCDNQFSHSCNE